MRQKPKGTKNDSLCLYFGRSGVPEEGYFQPDYTFFFNKISGSLYRIKFHCDFSMQNDKTMTTAPVRLTATVKAAG